MFESAWGEVGNPQIGPETLDPYRKCPGELRLTGVRAIDAGALTPG